MQIIEYDDNNVFVCPSCDSEFSVNYDKRDVDAEVSFCPFCGSPCDDDELEEDEEDYND